jgi:MFS family permease
MSVTTPAPTAKAPSAWAPLRVGAYRALWIALLISNIGTWMQTVGAQWLLLDAPNAVTLVALVQTASMLPILILALPAGVLADTLDRRRLLIGVQVFQVAVSVILASLTIAGQMGPALLLTLTFTLGAGAALMLPAWQALIPDLVPRQDLPAASALGAINMNAARAIGPAVAGVLISWAGVGFVFALNAVTFVAFALVLLFWRPRIDRPDRSPERFNAALRAGGRYVRHSPIVRRILLRATLFLVPGSALWALIPLVASRRLGLSASGYGLLLGALGVGAVAGAVLMPMLRQRLSTNGTLVASGVAYGVALLVVGIVPNSIAVLAALLFAGAAWIATLSMTNAAMQLFLPGWVRARGLSIYQISFAGSLGVASFGWGLLADLTNLVTTFGIAGAMMLAGTATMRRWPLIDTSGIDRSPAVYWPQPDLSLDPDPRTGPILVTARYKVEPANEAAFLESMSWVGRSRRRTGATRWGLFREGETPHQFVEVYLVPTWEEHLRQHSGRLTGADKVREEQALALATEPPAVAHLFPADTPDDSGDDERYVEPPT